MIVRTSYYGVLRVRLDELDHKILEVLRKDSRTPFTEVGRGLGVSDATVHVRVNKMIDEGVITGFTVKVDEEALGKRIHGFVLVNVQPGSLKDVVNGLLEHKEVNEVYEIHGPNDLIIKVEVEGLDELRSLILKVREIPNVETSELFTVFKVWKGNNA